MKTSLDDELCQTFPDIFRERKLPMNKTCMCWGFAVGDGWYDLIFALCKQLKLLRKLTGCQIIASQVKEKFGGLRFYVKIDTSKSKLKKDDLKEACEIIYNIVEGAKNRSFHICEQCGKSAKTKTISGWVVTLCPECYKKDQNA